MITPFGKPDLGECQSIGLFARDGWAMWQREVGAFGKRPF